MRQEPALGRTVAAILATSWRPTPSPYRGASAQLDAVLPCLTGSGAAALGWWRLGASPAALPAECRPAALHDAARLLAVNDMLRQRALARIASILNRHGIVPVLIKGWAAGRHYAESYLRPYGDFDLLVRPVDLAKARDVLVRHAAARPGFADPNVFSIATDTGFYDVDLHDRLSDAYALPVDAVFARAEQMTLPSGGTLLTPCLEDHLRIVILHFLRHGGWRPLWLCDVAAMTEAAGPTFDWELFFGADARLRGWLQATIAAAVELLECTPSHLPAEAIMPCPRWLVRALLEEWRAPYAQRAMPPPGTEFRDPIAWLRGKWPNPIRATLLRGAPVTSNRQRRHQLALFAIAEIPRALSRVFTRAWWQRLRASLLARKPFQTAAGQVDA